MWDRLERRLSEDARAGRTQPGERTARLSQSAGRTRDRSPATTPTAHSTPAARLLTAVSAPQADEVEKMKMELRRLRFDEQVRGEKRKSAGTPIESQVDGQPQALARGSDAAQGRGERPLPAGRVRRRPLAGSSGRGHGRIPKPGRVLPPHLSHREPEAPARGRLCSASPAGAATRWSSFRPISAAARRTRCWRSITCFPALRRRAGRHRCGDAGGRREDRSRRRERVVLVGNKISPGNPVTKPDGTVVRTLWGELAWQLGGKKAFARIKADDEKATSPATCCASCSTSTDLPDPDR